MRNSCIFSILVLVFFLVGCAKSKDDNAADTDIPAHSVVSGSSTLTSSTNQLSGTGSVLFDAELSAVSSGKNFKLTGSLDDGGQIAITTYSDSNLANGVSIVMNRSGSNLQVEIHQGSSTVATYTTQMTAGTNAVDPTGDFQVSIDVHNDESPTHLLIWNGTTTTNDASTALIEDETNLATGGTGKRYGLTLSNATVTKFETGDPLFEE